MVRRSVGLESIRHGNTLTLTTQGALRPGLICRSASIGPFPPVAASPRHAAMALLREALLRATRSTSPRADPHQLQQGAASVAATAIAALFSPPPAGWNMIRIAPASPIVTQCDPRTRTPSGRVVVRCRQVMPAFV